MIDSSIVQLQRRKGKETGKRDARAATSRLVTAVPLTFFAVFRILFWTLPFFLLAPAPALTISDMTLSLSLSLSLYRLP